MQHTSERLRKARFGSLHFFVIRCLETSSPIFTGAARH